MTLARMIRTSREGMKISQGELARRTGLHYSYISRLESGERIPDTAVLRTLSEHMDEPFMSLMVARMTDQLTQPERHEFGSLLETWTHQVT